jgi:hypothetical protein
MELFNKNSIYSTILGKNSTKVLFPLKLPLFNGDFINEKSPQYQHTTLGVVKFFLNLLNKKTPFQEFIL